MRFLIPALAFSLLSTPSGCGSRVSPINPVVTSLATASDSKDSKISAYAEATEVANQSNPDSPAKTAVFESNSVVRKLAGPASEKDRAEALALVNKALSGKLTEALDGWSKSRTDAGALAAQVVSLRQQVDDVRKQAALDAKAKVAAERKRWILMGTLGFGGLAVAGGVVVLVLGAQYPFLGPRIGFASIGAGLTLIALGIIINAVENALEAHPWIIGGGLLIAASLGIVAAVLTYANHRHHVTE